MKLQVICPTNNHTERQYVCDVLLGEILGVPAEVVFEERSGVAIEAEGQVLRLDDTFFSGAAQAWLKPESLPSCELVMADFRNESGIRPTLVERSVPVLFGRSLPEGRWVTCFDRDCHLGLDVFGSAFYLLSRYEEVVNRTRDKHDRFIADYLQPSTACCLERPIVNEYAEILWSCMARLWPGLVRKERQFRVMPSHDVDTVRFWPGKSLSQIAVEGRQVASRVRSALSLRPLMSWARTKSLGEKHDPYNTFDRLMQESERRNLRSAFYFIAGHTHAKSDPDYFIDDREIRRLLTTVHEHGHEIGLHPSYECYLSQERTGAELRMLRAVCDEEGITQEVYGSRQHFLRYSHPETARLCDGLGLTYDTSLGFADRAGFRCGVCCEFPVYDVIARRPLRLRERPLIVMDCTVTDERYMNLGNGERAFGLIAKLKDRCRMFGGDFTVLWHNSRLTQPEDWDLYCSVLNH